jgi:DNA adenine methylase
MSRDVEVRPERRAGDTPRASAGKNLSKRAAPAARPFLKWAGGKGQLIEQFRPLLPPQFHRYFEPFVGSGAVFFALRAQTKARDATLTDVNRELVDCYRAVKRDVEAVIAALRSHAYDEDHYYRVRDIDPAELPLAERAARAIFLNKTGYNGLYRVNKKGRFNVPFGRYTNPGFAGRESVENLRACARALRTVAIEVRDFGDVAVHAREGDFVYFDPPYVPASSTADFTSYVPGGFGLPEQERLADVFARLTQMGVRAMLSNSDTPAVRALYRAYRVDTVLASRSINSRGDKRGKVGEVVVRNY